MLEYILAVYLFEDAPLFRWVLNKIEDSERRIQMNDYEKPEVKIYDIGDTNNGPGADDMGDKSNSFNKDDIWT